MKPPVAAVLADRVECRPLDLPPPNRQYLDSCFFLRFCKTRAYEGLVSFESLAIQSRSIKYLEEPRARGFELSLEIVPSLETRTTHSQSLT